MEQTSVSIFTLTEACLSKFNNLLASYTQSTQCRTLLEGRRSEFHHWAISVGALAKPGASLDSRLQDQTKDLEIVKDLLLFLAECLDGYAGPAEVKTSHGEADQDRAIQKLDANIKRLFRFSEAILRLEKASWNREADQTFNPDGYKELRKDLECVLLLRPTEEALFHRAENGEYVTRLDNCKLSDIQKRLVEANLRRRHRLMVAQKRVKLQLHSSPHATPSSSKSLQKEPPSDVQNAADDRDPTLYTATKDQEITAPTVSGSPMTSTAVETLQHDSEHYTSVAAKTQVSFISFGVEFPKAPPIPSGQEILECPCCCELLPVQVFQDPDLWKQLFTWSQVPTVGITSCPLCSWSGPEDSPKLLEHIFRHTYDFALRALPWPQPIVQDLNVLPGRFNPPKDSSRLEDLDNWINEAVHESAGLPEIELSDYDRADHCAPASTDLVEYNDYCLMNEYFNEESADGSSKSQLGESTVSAS
ncbi:hypothetical protein ACHAPX_004513 [Trichoderma viride]